MGDYDAKETDQNCSYSKIENFKCNVVHDDIGQPLQKCEVLQQLIRRCKGKPPEVLEFSREEIGGDHESPFTKDFFKEGWSAEQFGRYQTPFTLAEGIMEGSRAREIPDFNRKGNHVEWNISSEPHDFTFLDRWRKKLDEGIKAGAGILSELDDVIKIAESFGVEFSKLFKEPQSLDPQASANPKEHGAQERTRVEEGQSFESLFNSFLTGRKEDTKRNPAVDYSEFSSSFDEV